MNNIASILEGIFGFSIGIYFGHKMGIKSWEASHGWRGYTNYTVEFFLAVFVGVMTQLAAHSLGNLVDFLPAWLNTFLCTATIGFIGGCVCGFKLGYSRVRSGYSNFEASKVPSVLGVTVGLAAYVFFK